MDWIPEKRLSVFVQYGLSERGRVLMAKLSQVQGLLADVAGCYTRDRAGAEDPRQGWPPGSA